jgi:hypothetical protein
MANNDILSEFSSSEISHFKKDFIQMVKVGAELDRYYGKAQHDLDAFIPKFEALAEKFNKKYRDLKIKTKKTIESYKVRLFVREKSIKEFFAKTASRIPGLKSLGRTGFNQADVSDAENFARFLDSLMDKIYISYSNPETGTSTIAAAYDKREKMIEIVCTPSEIINEISAGFRICAFYALSNGFDRRIELYGDASSFGFYNLLDEMEKREWYDKFNPRWLE